MPEWLLVILSSIYVTLSLISLKKNNTLYVLK